MGHAVLGDKQKHFGRNLCKSRHAVEKESLRSYEFYDS